MYLQQLFLQGLGHASYLIGSEQTHEAAVVDPRRDVQIYIDQAEAAGLRIRYVLETHVHNDFVSGARQLALALQAEHVASSEAGLQFPYHGVRAGDELRLGELLIRVLFTPGHTPEHVTYVVIDTSRANVPVLAFTGGDLLVGAVGRPDLLGRELGEQLAPLLYESLHNQILQLEDYVEVLPTHGSGSLCGRGITGKRTSTIGYERRFNPALQLKTKEEFVSFVLDGNPGIPAYYRWMRPTNQGGPTPWTAPAPNALSPREAEHLLGHGALVLDTRSSAAFGRGHLPGAINVGLSDSFATWVGWLLPPDVPLILVLKQEDDWEEVVTSLARVGYERIAGYLKGGVSAWESAGLPSARLAQWKVQQLAEQLVDPALQVLDVRTDAEWDEGHIRGARHIPLGDLPGRMDELDRNRLVAVICGSGYRSSAGASLLQQQGFTTVMNVVGGMEAWSASRHPTVTTEEKKEQPDGSPGTEPVRVRQADQSELRRSA